jgi:hypothetical protein
LRQLLMPIDRRLAVIERLLGLDDDEEAAPGFRGPLRSVHRRLAAIEGHLGISAPDAQESGPADKEGGEEGPTATAE